MAEPELWSGRYEILRHVARGGMAEVYLARDHLLDRPVALKVLFPEYARDEAFVERFRREAKSAAGLNHPNIVAVYDWGEEGGTYFIVMEYVEGQSLRDLIRNEGPLMPERAAEIAADIASALSFAHRHGVVHRDVKPGNVLITPQGQVKVTDFGIARGRGSGALTRTGMVMGTAAYFSPEQAQGLDVDPRSDVYSLGVVLYEMVVGQAPFSGDDPVAIAYQHVREEPVPPGVRNPDVPLDMERVILTSLAKAPDSRYPSAEDFRADLVRFARGLPVEGGPVTAMVAGVADTTMVGGRGADATAVTARADATTVTPAGLPPPVAARRRRAAFVVTLIALVAVIAALLFLLGRELGLFGSDQVTVPDVRNLTLEDARSELQAEGLKVKAEFEENETVAENLVFRQTPRPGREIDEGGTVRLVVSQGVGELPVPNVVDKRRAEAIDILEDRGFEVNEESEFSDVVDRGRVVRTDPTPNTVAEKGSEVTIYVSAGVEQASVPDVRGLPLAEALERLVNEGFRTDTEEAPSDEIEEGSVIRTNPRQGTEAPKGSVVRVLVSSGPAPVPVPNVLDELEENAHSDIEDAGLEPESEFTTDCRENQDGRVVDQDPQPETEVEPGSTVTVTVCDFDEAGGGGGGGPGGGGGN